MDSLSSLTMTWSLYEEWLAWSTIRCLSDPRYILLMTLVVITIFRREMSCNRVYSSHVQHKKHPNKAKSDSVDYLTTVRAWLDYLCCGHRVSGTRAAPSFSHTENVLDLVGTSYYAGLPFVRLSSPVLVVARELWEELDSASCSDTNVGTAQDPWSLLPDVLRVKVLSFLHPRDIVTAVALLNKASYRLVGGGSSSSKKDFMATDLLWRTLWYRDFAWAVETWDVGRAALERSLQRNRNSLAVANTRQTGWFGLLLRLAGHGIVHKNRKELLSPAEIVEHDLIDYGELSTLRFAAGFFTRDFYFRFHLAFVNYVVAGCNRYDCCLVGMHGHIYDLTDFLDQHPGSPETVLCHAGRDVTDLFDRVVRHSTHARVLANALCVVVDQSRRPPGVGWFTSSNEAIPDESNQPGWGLRPTTRAISLLAKVFPFPQPVTAPPTVSANMRRDSQAWPVQQPESASVEDSSREPNENDSHRPSSSAPSQLPPPTRETSTSTGSSNEPGSYFGGTLQSLRDWYVGREQELIERMRPRIPHKDRVGEFHVFYDPIQQQWKAWYTSPHFETVFVDNLEDEST
jgi:Cytochrome b5-like Heme/Steroid binding domain